MKKIKALLIDDEQHNIELLKSMLDKYCASIDVCGFASNADYATELIHTHQPELIFLDVKMPEKNGFELLRSLKEINFKIIFVTGFDEYAIQAFEFSAVDYILKPIDYTKLIKAVDKATSLITQEQMSNVIHFINNFDETNNIIKSIPLHHQDKVYLINISDISFVEALRGYSEVYTTDGKKFTSSKSLTEYEELLVPHQQFVRINKSEIINMQQIQHYTKGSDCFITLKGCAREFEVSRRKKTEILQKLK